MSLINGSHDRPNYYGLLCSMNVTSTTAVSCSVATSSSESLANDGEKHNQPKRLLFTKCDYGQISIQFNSDSAEVILINLY